VWETFSLALRIEKHEEKRILDILHKVRELAEQVDTPRGYALLSLVEGAWLFYPGGRFQEALEPLENAETIFSEQCVRNYSERNFATFLRYSVHEYTGNIAAFSNELPQRIHEASQKRDRLALQTLGWYQPLTYLAIDEAQAALDYIEQTRSLWSRSNVLKNMMALREVQVHLYLGNSTLAFDKITRLWKTLQHNPIYRMRFVNIWFRCFSIISSLSVYVTNRRKDTRRAIQRDAAAFRKVKRGYTGFGTLIEAILAYHALDKRSAISHMRKAIHEFHSNQLYGYEVSAKRRLGEMIGGTEEEALITEADKKLQGLGFRNPARASAIYIPSINARG
jgi:hypothetical protein